MRRPVLQGAGKHVGSVALRLQEADVVPDERGHQLVGVGDPEGGERPAAVPVSTMR